MKYKQDNDFDVIFDLENKLIRANKRAGKWREKYINNFNLYTEKIIYWRKQNDILTEERDIARKLFVITSRKLEQNREWLKVSNLKQKKAWIAFYIATIIYIVGIIIFIWK